MTSFIERIIAEAETELQRVNTELSSLDDAMNRVLAVVEEIQHRQQEAARTKAEVIRVLTAMTGDPDDPPEPVDVPVIDRRTGEPVELGPVEAVAPVEPDGGPPQTADEAVASPLPSGNGHPEAAPDPVSTELESVRNEAKTPQRVSLEQVRDVVVTLPDTFGTKDVADALGISRGTAKKYVDMLVNHKPPILEQHGTVGRYVRYTYIPPQNGRGPTHRPRSERDVMRRAGVGSASPGKRKGDQAVARTGRAKGRSGKPGLDKARAAQGIRVRRGRVGS